MINLYHLRYFVDAALAESLSFAAKKNRVSQSAVSQAICSLERSIGFRLISHQKRVFQLTEEGRALLIHSDQIFKSLEALDEAIQNFGSEYMGSLSIGCTHSIAIGWLSVVLVELRHRYPKLRLIVRIGNSETIKDWIILKEVEMGLMVDDGNITRDFQRVLICSGEYVLFRGKEQSRSHIRDLVVTRSERAEVRYYLKHLQKLSLPKEIRFEMTSWEAIKAYSIESGAFGICPDYVVRDELEKGILIAEKVPFKRPRYRFIAIYLSRQKLSKNSRLLLSTIHHHESQVGFSSRIL